MFLAYLLVKNDNKKLLNFDGFKGHLNLVAFSNYGLNSFLFSVVLGFTFVKLYYNLINPPFGWDSLNYHFTFAVEWLKNKNLNTPLVISDNPCPTYFPINGSLIYLWFIFPFKSVFLADIGQAPFFILAGLSAYSLSRKMGLPKQWAFFVAILMSTTPNYFKQLSIAYVDIMVCAWYLTALNFLIGIKINYKFRNIIIFSLSLGMLIGTKTIALVYSFILIIFFIYILIKKGLRSISLLYAAIIFATLIFITGSFSYIRNFIQTGNPLFPNLLKVFNLVIFKGVMDKTNFIAFKSLEDYSLYKILFSEGMGAGIIIFVIPGIILFLFLMLKKRNIINLLLASSFIYIYIIYRYIFSFPNIRYLYSIVGIGYIMAFYSLYNLNFPRRILNWLVVICAISFMPEMARRLELVYAITASLILFAIMPIVLKFLRKHLIVSIILAVIFICVFINIASNNYNRNEYKSYIKTIKFTGFWPDAVKAWEWLNSHTTGNNIAYIGRPVPFPLYGTNFKNNVFYVSINRVDPVKLHYFPYGCYRWSSDFYSMHKSFEEKGNYRSGGDYSIWLGNLTRRKVDYLFIYSLHQTKEVIFPIEDNWAAGHPQQFRLAYENPTVHIYEIIHHHSLP
jgi:hypothetical protein